MKEDNMKQGWEIKKLGEVCKITMGQSPSSNTYNDSEGLPFYQGNADFGKVNPIARVYCNAPIRIAENNDILISVRAPIGAINIANCKCCIGRGLASIRSTQTLSNEFVYHALIANKEKLIAQGTGSTFKSIGRNTLEELPIPVPPLPVQEQIVSELDLLSGIIEKKREQLKELDALTQSIFYDMFGDPITNEKGWEVKKLGEVFCVKIGPFGSLLHNSDYISGGVPLVNPIHMQDEHICPDVNFTISNVKIQELQSYILHTNDIVLARRGDIGRCAIVGEKEDGYLCGTGSLFIRATTAIISTYMIKLFRSNSMIKHLTSLAKGATMLNINCKIIENLIIPIPPLPLQHQFASKIEAIERQKELIKQSISETETLFNERMQHYFG